MRASSYTILRPETGLQKYVDYFWMGEICPDAAKSQPFRHLAPASTTVDLIFFDKGSFKDSRTGSAIQSNGIIYGQKTSFDQYTTTSEKARIFGVKLKPSVVLATLDIPASGITGQQADLQTLFGRKGEKLTGLILSVQTLEERAAAFSLFLKEHQQVLDPKFEALGNLIHSIDYTRDHAAINRCSEQYFLSKRQFERDFKALTGLSFRSFIKLKRFENCFHSIQTRQCRSDLTRLAYQSGYYDQAHFNRDFREFTGLCPKKYIRDFCTGST